jgi:hypothetical protein
LGEAKIFAFELGVMDVVISDIHMEGEGCSLVEGLG